LATGGLGFNYGTGIDTTGTTRVSLGGVVTMKGYAPLATGNVVGTATLGAGAAIEATAAGTTITAAATVTGGTELSAITTLVNSLIAKINALNKLVIKIQKKVRA
jgi:hypothetical protein